MPTKKEISILLASLVMAALVGTLAYSVISFASYEITTTNRFTHSDIFTVLYVWIVAAIVSIPVAIVGGAPAYFILRKLAAFNWLSVTIVGVVLGLFARLAGITFYLSWLHCGAIGAACAFTAWLLLKNSNYSFKTDASGAA